jgi:hypothetical protein
MNVEILTEPMQFQEKEHINEIFLAVYGSNSAEYRHTKRQLDGPYLRLPVPVCHVERLLIDRKDSSPLPACNSGSCHLYSTTGQTRVSGDLHNNGC